MIRPSHPLVYLITDRRSLPAKSGDQRRLLIDLIRRAVDAEVDLVQIREKDLPAGTLLSLIDEALAIARSSGTRILVNDR
ncbi:MAG TPA: thiamine phosphate synthase, partial [Blastocatellia bacterium]|nr:thiamine phosphate synthase [Blastocatellia bacterium]